MNGSAGAPEVIDVITSVHFILLAVVAAAVLVALVFAIRVRARARHEHEAAAEHRGQAADRVDARVDAPTAPPPPPLADTPIPAAAPLDAAPATVAAAEAEDDRAPENAETGSPDDLTQLKGVGPKLAAQLAGLGYTRFAQIAALSSGEAEALDAQLGTFRGRLARDRWIEQAEYLAKSDRAGFERNFGKL